MTKLEESAFDGPKVGCGAWSGPGWESESTVKVGRLCPQPKAVSFVQRLN